MIDNNKGAASFGIVALVLIATSLIIFMFLPLLLNLNKVQNEESTTNIAYTNNMNAMERIHGYFAKNISHATDFNFEDLGKNYIVKEVSEVKRLTGDSSMSLYINNLTDITLDVKATPRDKNKPMSYTVKLYYEEGDRVIKEITSSSPKTTIYVDESEVYNVSTGKTNYGHYKVEYSDIVNAEMRSDFTYYRLYSRVVNISGDNFNQNVEVDNYNTLNSNKVTFLK